MGGAGSFFMLAGLLVAAVGPAQAARAVWASPDPVGNGMLLALSCYVGCALFSAGALMPRAAARRGRGPVPGRLRRARRAGPAAAGLEVTPVKGPTKDVRLRFPL